MVPKEHKVSACFNLLKLFERVLYVLMGQRLTRVQIEGGTPSSLGRWRAEAVSTASTRQIPPPSLPCLYIPLNQPTKSSFPVIYCTRIMSDRAAVLKKRFPRFRILVIGRANAGKTTLLQRVCKTTESPIVRDRNGNKVTAALLCFQPTVVH